MPTASIDANGNTNTWSYDDTGNILSSCDTAGATTDYTYWDSQTNSSFYRPKLVKTERRSAPRAFAVTRSYIQLHRQWRCGDDGGVA